MTKLKQAQQQLFHDLGSLRRTEVTIQDFIRRYGCNLAAQNRIDVFIIDMRKSVLDTFNYIKSQEPTQKSLNKSRRQLLHTQRTPDTNEHSTGR